MHATMLIIRNDAAEIELYHADDSLVPDNNTLSDNDGHIYKKGDAVYHFHFSFQMWCLQMYFSLFLFLNNLNVIFDNLQIYTYCILLFAFNPLLQIT